MTYRTLLRVFLWLLLLTQTGHGNDAAFEDRVRAIASELRCVVCQNLSVADSPSEMATQMRTVVRQQLKEGSSPEAIKAYFVSKYGDWVLLAPPRRGFSLLVWVLPFLVLGVGLLWAGWILYRWSRRKSLPAKQVVDPVLLQRIRAELAAIEATGALPGDMTSGAKSRVYADLRELELDYQAGKLSQADHQIMRDLYESQAASILATEKVEESHAMPNAVHEKTPPAAPTPVARRGWVYAVGAVVLLVGGITVGLLLGQSLRPRTSTEDSITGDFLTGTSAPANARTAQANVNDLLTAGRIAFEKKDLKNAIKNFKEVLSSDPENPVANAYMGLVLAQAGHSDAALLALNRALSRAPRLPVALWAKGMILYRDKQDLVGARKNFVALAQLLPPGEDKESIQKMIAQIDGGSPGQAKTEKAPSLTGTILIDPKFLGRVDPSAVLFIIARSPGSKRGPPLAVKRVASPAFPLSFILGPSNVMIPGTAFSGSVDLLVRLDKDGNPMTREPGSFTGVYRGNPVDIGTGDLEITIDQMVGQ